MVLAAVLVPSAAVVVQAASSTDYMDKATDPHGDIWLRGTTDGTTAGPMDPGTNPLSATFGHLWTTDVPSGFCRVDSVTAADGTVSQQLARPNAFPGAPASGGCITTGGKSSQPTLDPRRNADGTFYVYSCDWAVFSQGCFRMTYDPGAQLMTNAELLAPGRFPTATRGIKPFTTALGGDGNLYVTSDITQYVYRFLRPNDPNTGNQTVEVVATSVSNTRMRASTFACWDPLRGGTTGLPTCAQAAAAGNPVPDLVLDEKAGMSVLMDVANCKGVGLDVTAGNGAPLSTPACVAVDESTHIHALTPMGAYTQGIWDQTLLAPAAYNPAVLPKYNGTVANGGHLDPNVIYVSDSPGATTTILRYHINTDTQDSFSNFGVFPDGSTRQYSFGFSPTQAPDGTMYLGDDPSAGANAFNGNLWRIPAGAPADVNGAPGAPASPPPPAAQKVGVLYGSGTTLPNDGIWLPVYTDATGRTVNTTLNADGSSKGHLWLADSLNGLCRMDVNPTPGAQSPVTAAGAPFFENTATCNLASAKPGQSVLDPNPQADGTHWLYVSDASTRGIGVVKLVYDWAGTVCKDATGALLGPESLCNPGGLATSPVVTVAPGQGLDGQKADALAIDPSAGANGALYVGFLNRNSTAPTELARVNNPGTATETVDFVANATRHKPIFNLAFAKNPGDPTQYDLYVGNNGGLDELANPKACAPNACATLQVLNVRGPKGMALDPVTADKIYMAGPAIPPTCPGPTCTPGSVKTSVDVFTVSTGDVQPFTSQGSWADGTLDTYDVVDSLTADPQGNVYVSDDPNPAPPPNTQGRTFKVPAATQEPLPSIVTKPNTVTNQSTPTFAFQDADAAAKFKCSLVPVTGADSFGGCTSPVTFGASAAGSTTAVIGSTTPLPDGTYVFKVEATGAAGTSFVAAYTFTIDTVKPVVTITSSPQSPSGDNTPTFVWSVDKEGSTSQCSLSSGADNFQACSAPITYPVQPDGDYTFKVFATDAAGNVSATVSSTLTIDTAAPTVTASPAGGQFTTAQDVVLTASQSPATIFYTLDGTTPTTATTTNGASPLTVHVAQSATLKYFAVDAAGNQGQVASQTYTLGSITITQNPPALSNSKTATFAWTDATAGATFQCSLVPQTATDAFTPCTSPVTLTAAADGAYRFAVKDSAGGSAQFLFAIDTTAPTVTITQNPPNPQTSSTATFGFSATDANGPVTFQCSFGLQTAADAFSACTSLKTYSGLTDGAYQFKVKGTDAAGNTSAPVVYQFSVGASAPPKVTQAPAQTLVGLTTATAGTSATTTATGPITAKATAPNSNTATAPVTISWAGTACTSGQTNCNVDHYVVQQSVNGGGFSNVTLPAPDPVNGPATSVTLNLKVSPINNSVPATTYRFQVQVVDKAGNVTPFSIAPSFIVPDTDNSFSSSLAGGWSSQNLSGTFGGSVAFSSTSNATAGPSNGQQATSYALVSTLGPDRGIAQIKVDGQQVATVDLYAPTQTLAQVVWSINGLTPGVTHTIQVVSTNTRNPASSGTRVDYDAILALR